MLLAQDEEQGRANGGEPKFLNTFVTVKGVFLIGPREVPVEIAQGFFLIGPREVPVEIAQRCYKRFRNVV